MYLCCCLILSRCNLIVFFFCLSFHFIKIICSLSVLSNVLFGTADCQCSLFAECKNLPCKGRLDSICCSNRQKSAHFLVCLAEIILSYPVPLPNKLDNSVTSLLYLPKHFFPPYLFLHYNLSLCFEKSNLFTGENITAF